MKGRETWAPSGELRHQGPPQIPASAALHTPTQRPAPRGVSGEKQLLTPATAPTTQASSGTLWARKRETHTFGNDPMAPPALGSLL